jgi:cysteine desulfurase/selenocysteine lyase
VATTDGIWVGSPADRVSVSFTVGGTEAQQVAEFLDRSAATAVRSGHLSTQPLLRTLGLEAAARASFGAYNAPAEVEVLVEAVGRCARRAKSAGK